MSLDKKSVSVLIILGLVSVCLSLYTLSAYAVARYAFGDESGGGWLYTPSGSFIPWPKEPGMAAALSKMSEIDLLIYRYLVKSWVLVGVTVLLWIVTGLYLFGRITAFGERKKGRRKPRKDLSFGNKSKAQSNIQIVDIRGRIS